MAITEEQVHAAAARLDAEGRKATVIAVRDALGTGSYSTIRKYLQTYQPLPVDLEPVPDAPTPPDDLRQAFETLWARAVQLARAEAEQAINAEREQADQAIIAAQVSRDSAVDECNAALERLDALAISEEQLLGRLERLTAESQAAALRERELETRLDDARREIDRLYRLVEAEKATGRKRRLKPADPDVTA